MKVICDMNAEQEPLELKIPEQGQHEPQKIKEKSKAGVFLSNVSFL